MKRLVHVPLMAVFLLGGCGPAVDVASNPPRLGQWQRQSKLLTLVANDVWLDRKEAPFTLPPDSDEIKDCFEPTLKSRNEINRDMLANSEKICHLDAIEEKDGVLNSNGTCGPTQKGGMTISGTIEVTGREREEVAEAKVAIALNVTDKSGASERVRVAYETKWTRIGDCKR